MDASPLIADCMQARWQSRQAVMQSALLLSIPFSAPDEFTNAGEATLARTSVRASVGACTKVFLRVRRPQPIPQRRAAYVIASYWSRNARIRL